MGLKSCVAVDLLKLVRILQYKWGTIFRQEWFWRMEKLSKRNGKGIGLRENVKAPNMFEASIEWLIERIAMREEIDTIGKNGEKEVGEKAQMVRAKRMKSIEEVLEEVSVLTDTHFFDEFSETKSSVFLKKVISHQRAIDLRLFRKK